MNSYCGFDNNVNHSTCYDSKIIIYNDLFSVIRIVSTNQFIFQWTDRSLRR